MAHADARWPDFTERALRHDIVTTFAVPLRRRGNLLGTLNVFVPTLPDTTPADDSTSELHVAQALADAAALGLQNRSTYAQYRALSGQLQGALSSRVRADEAFMALRQYARRQRLPLDQVASAVVEGVVDDAELRRESGTSADGPA
ncbi:hypothetical protein [Streptomyces canus]|uniref:hypothetical protein n=1 Tax=Streptomyces canus TaxID=58343 RepID=UPI0038502BB0